MGPGKSSGKNTPLAAERPYPLDCACPCAAAGARTRPWPIDQALFKRAPEGRASVQGQKPAQRRHQEGRRAYGWAGVKGRPGIRLELVVGALAIGALIEVCEPN